MVSLVKKKTTRDEGYHDFIYVDGKKVPKEKSAVRYCYLDNPNEHNLRMFKVTDREDIAGSVDGIFLITDELDCENGTAVVDGVKYNAWGTVYNGVIVSADGEQIHYIGPSEDGKTFVSHPHQKERTEAYKKIYRHYNMLI